jgi:hypothetical protein
MKPHFFLQNTFHYRSENTERLQEGKCMCVCKRISFSRTVRSSIRMGWDNMVSETSTERFVFRTRAGPLCPAESSKMQLCGHRKKAEKTDWDGVCSGVWCVCNKTSYIPWTMCAKASFFHDNQVPHPKYQWFCAVISVRIRKARSNEFPLCFRCVTSLCTHPHMYHQRSTPSRIHWELHVKGAVLLSSIHCTTMTKISQKILLHALIWKIHGLVFSTRVEDEFLGSCTCT